MNPSWMLQSPLQLFSDIQCRQITTGMESSILMNQCDEGLASVFGQDIQKYWSPTNNSLLSSSTDNYSNFSSIQNTGIVDFGNQNPSESVIEQVRLNHVEEIVVPEGTYNLSSEQVTTMPRVQLPAKKKRIRPLSQTYDHIIAERRRREQLNQLFVALSALIPSLKKMDKSSILEDAIKHMKHLQERLKLLEEFSERKEMESLLFVRRSQIMIEGISEEQPLPEIEARLYDNQILLKVHCEKQKDALANLIGKVESLDMMVISTNATPFGDVTLDITIVAKMEKEFNLTVKDVVMALREALHSAS